MSESRLVLQGPRQVTGRMVLITIVAFFAVIVAVNLTMALLAISTFGGVETRNAYQAGLAFSQEIAAARAQQARNWRVDAKVSPRAQGGFTIDLSVKDGSGRPVSMADFKVTFAHPANRSADHVVPMREVSAGVFRGDSEIAAGQWDFLIEGTKDGERVFRSKNRTQVR